MLLPDSWVEDFPFGRFNFTCVVSFWTCFSFRFWINFSEVLILGYLCWNKRDVWKFCDEIGQNSQLTYALQSISDYIIIAFAKIASFCISACGIHVTFMTSSLAFIYIWVQRNIIYQSRLSLGYSPISAIMGICFPLKSCMFFIAGLEMSGIRFRNFVFFSLKLGPPCFCLSVG